MKKALERVILAAVIFAAVIQAGCGTVELQPKASDYEPVHRGENSIVMIGLAATWNGKAVDPVDEFTGMSSIPFQLAVASLDADECLKRKTVFVVPRSANGDRRWVYLMLPPGAYYIWDIPPTLLPRDLEFKREETGGLRLEVQAGKPVQYAGTVKFELEGGKFIMEKFYHSFKVSVHNEVDAARAVASANFGQYGPMASSLMWRYGQMNGEAGGLFPALITSQSTMTLKSPDWKRLETQKALWPSGFFGGVAGGGGDPRGTGGAAFLALAWYPIGSYIGSEAGEARIRKWQPCIETMQNELIDMTPGVRLRERLAAALGGRGIVFDGDDIGAKPSEAALRLNCNALLLADIRRIRLRECSRDKFCAEVAVRFRLRDVRTERYIFDQTIVYTSPNAAAAEGEIEPRDLDWMLAMPFPQAYEAALASPSEERQMDAYCGETGRGVFAAEIDRGLDLAVQRFLEMLRPDGRK